MRGDGTVRRCHFIARADRQPLRRLVAGRAAAPHLRRNALCDCHIGYVHLKPLGLRDVFAGGILERIPAAWPVHRPATA